MKSDLQLLQLLKDNIKVINSNPTITINCYGLCALTRRLHDTKDLITKQECDRLLSLIETNKPKNTEKWCSPYWFRQGSIPPRLKWVDDMINKYKTRETQ